MIPKFRAWDKHLKLMRNASYIDFDGKEIMFYADDFEDNEDCPSLDIVRNFEEVEIMQSTGLKDKNGTEIYEGDILKTRTKGFVAVRIELGNAMVTYQSGVNTRTTLVLSSFLDKYKVKVIGNIYENMELLEVK